MDAAELIAFQYLAKAGNFTVVHEPDGNIPPDFALDGKIAVEVTRLNSHYFGHEGEPYALEQFFTPVYQWLDRILSSYGSSLNDESWYVCFSLVHPFKSFGHVKAGIKSVLDEFYSDVNRQESTKNVFGALELDFLKAGVSNGSFFTIGGGTEDVIGVLLVEEIYKNTKYLIEHKGRKIAPYKSFYQEWWLMLIVDNGLIFGDEDFQQIKSLCIQRGIWNKVLLVNPHFSMLAYEI